MTLCKFYLFIFIHIFLLSIITFTLSDFMRTFLCKKTTSAMDKLKPQMQKVDFKCIKTLFIKALGLAGQTESACASESLSEVTADQGEVRM